LLARRAGAYSYRKATAGSRLTALFAGKNPDRKPIAEVLAMTVSMSHGETGNGASVSDLDFRHISDDLLGHLNWNRVKSNFN
jgi:hypothetical protein